MTALREPAFRLHVEKGPDAGKEFVLEGTQAPRVLLGTSATCDFRLTDRAVSRRHLALELSDKTLRVIELGSTNGTSARGVSLREVILHGGETLELGETVIQVSVDSSLAKAFVSDETSFGRYLGHSVAMRRLYPICAKLAASSISVVIEGETGTGKELLAEVIHERGPRANQPFVPVDCVTLSTARIAEAVSEAAGGTLFLDEVSEVHPDVQAILGSMLESATKRGGLRVLASSSRDLDREVAERRFRDDLYYLLAVSRIELPPLRARREDIGVLAEHFWSGHGGGAEGLPREVLQRWSAYHWPGNVRELSNAVLRELTLGSAGHLTEKSPTPASSPPGEATAVAAPSRALGAEDFITTVVARGLPLTRARQIVIEEFERCYVEDAFVRNDSNVTKAAAASGIARRYFRALRARQRGS